MSISLGVSERHMRGRGGRRGGGEGSNDSTGHTDGSKGMSDTLMATWSKYWHLATYIKTVLSGFVT